MLQCAVEVRPPAGRSNGDTRADEAVASFEDVRHRLFGIAYQTLGRVADAEDIVQDVWVRWQSADRTQVRDRTGFLVTITRRIALNAATSARARREVSVGEWLPEHDAASVDPQVHAECSEAIAFALALLLERLSPVERAVYVLREAFAYPFREIGEVLAISEANARQVAHRAREHLTGHQPEAVESPACDELLAAFLGAARGGDVAALIDLLGGTDARFAECRPNAAASRCRAWPRRTIREGSQSG
jgi:RNA polymerase sigma-70 factor, ECF subfamily